MRDSHYRRAMGRLI